jgi:type IV secretory pathway VirB10-like protein
VYTSVAVQKPLEPAGYGYLRKAPPPAPEPPKIVPPAPLPTPAKVQTAPVRQQPTQHTAKPARAVVTPKPPEPMNSFEFGESGIKDSGNIIKAQFSGDARGRDGAGQAGQENRGPPGMSQGNMQQRDFLKGGAADDYVTTPWAAPISDYMLRASTLIQAKAINSVTTELPGSIAAMVTRDIKDSIRGECTLIPATSILFGDSNDQVNYGQELMQTRWRRILFPDGSSQNLGVMAGTDKFGRSGIDGEVDHHYVPFFAAILGDAALKMLSQSGQYFQDDSGGGQVNIGYAGAGAFGNSVSNAGNEIVRKELDRQNVIKINPGDEIGLMLTRDVALPPFNNCEDY